jgi:hypothetical protein
MEIGADILFVVVVSLVILVLILPVTFPLFVAAAHLLHKEWPSRTAVILYVVGEIFSIAATATLIDFYLWAAKQ